MVRALAVALAAAAAVAGLWPAAVALTVAALASLVPRALGHGWPGLGGARAEALVLLVLLIVAGQVIGTSLGLFRDLWWWDVALHAAAGFAAGSAGAMLAGALLGRALSAPRAALLTALAAFGVAVAVGALWEIFEFAVGRLTGVSMQPGLADTMADLALDAAGGLLAAGAGARAAWRERQTVLRAVDRQARAADR